MSSDKEMTDAQDAEVKKVHSKKLKRKIWGSGGMTRADLRKKTPEQIKHECYCNLPKRLRDFYKDERGMKRAKPTMSPVNVYPGF